MSERVNHPQERAMSERKRGPTVGESCPDFVRTDVAVHELTRLRSIEQAAMGALRWMQRFNERTTMAAEQRETLTDVMKPLRKALDSR